MVGLEGCEMEWGGEQGANRIKADTKDDRKKSQKEISGGNLRDYGWRRGLRRRLEVRGDTRFRFF